MKYQKLKTGLIKETSSKMILFDAQVTKKNSRINLKKEKPV